MTRALGWRPDPPKVEGETPDRNARERLRAAPVPAYASNRSLIVEVLDQGALGSCVANAALQAVRASHRRQGVSAPPLGSRLALYYLSRAQMGETEIDGGTYLRLAFQSLNTFGFCPEDVWPYSDTGDRWKTAPSKDAYRLAYDQRAKVGRPVAYYRIYEDGFERVFAVKRALAAGYVVCFGTDVSDAFCAGDLGSGPISAPIGQSIAGGHAMCIVGYDGDTFTICNSWGPGFGDGGYCRFRADYIAWSKSRDFWFVEAAPPFAAEAAA